MKKAGEMEMPGDFLLRLQAGRLGVHAARKELGDAALKPREPRDVPRKEVQYGTRWRDPDTNPRQDHSWVEILLGVGLLALTGLGFLLLASDGGHSPTQTPRRRRKKA